MRDMFRCSLLRRPPYQKRAPAYFVLAGPVDGTLRLGAASSALGGSRRFGPGGGETPRLQNFLAPMALYLIFDQPASALITECVSLVSKLISVVIREQAFGARARTCARYLQGQDIVHGVDA